MLRVAKMAADAGLKVAPHTWSDAVAVTALSLGYDMTQPLLAGIVTALGGRRGGQAMGLNVFLLFTGFGLGSLIFGEALRLGFPAALGLFALVQGGAAVTAVPLFRSE